METVKNKSLKTVLFTIAILLVINAIGSRFFYRFDLTQDHRYTLSKTSLDIVGNVGEPLTVEVFLDGEFPGEFKKLQVETQNLLDEFKAYNPDIVYTFTNPSDDSEDQDVEKRDLIYKLFTLNNTVHSKKEENEIKASIKQIPDLKKVLIASFAQNGMTPATVTVQDKGKESQEVIFPWAIATYKNRSVVIPLLKNQMTKTTAEKVQHSVQNLEYAFANGLNTIVKEKQKKIAVIKGNGELQDIHMADFIKQVRENYHIGTFTLDSVAKKPNESLQYLKKYDLAIIAKPTEKFSDEEKLVLDQFVMNGGKTLWLVDQVNIEMDSLYNDSGASLAFPFDLNLNDMFFKYGVRINPTLVKDVMATPIALATGEQGSATQYTQYPWFYSPLIYPASKNPIVTNVDALKFEFANGMDTLKNGIKKTVLLKSSPFSKLVGTPVEVNLNMVSERPEQSEFKGTGNIPMAVLLEGKFHSVYQNRVMPFTEKTFQAVGKDNKMIVISDGDLIRNQLDKNGQPLELGYDKWTNKLYGNKEFMMNCVNYLLDDTGLINIRSKEVNLPLLDKEKVYSNYAQTQWITVGLPIVVLAIFGFVFTFLRKRKYSR
ncbi:gliding motility-associated ABC transporter substrate-binding protein GldG [Flavobacterium sp.]|uniref:gliding motility-associated ABC transporter substrate-binding protein GldG n=1 Tax=Flavobacterium sp. TaxID=239 RepID=UPI00286CA67C|nr:gliding motility-associated ABC transporter substrate-binding protein GldG [Flavobacterium sp.]